MNDKNFRTSLVALLKGGQAHSPIQAALEGIDPKHRTVKTAGFSHSIWELLEHMRLAQHDILHYTLDPNWVSPEFPAGYWPRNPEHVQDADWHKSVSGFLADLNETIKLVEEQSIDLTAEIPHAKEHTYLRDILLIADHNAYHLGQLIQVRKALEDWAA